MRRKSIIKSILSVFAIISLALILTNSLSPELTYARPGGGHSYKNNSSSSSSSNSSSSSSSNSSTYSSEDDDDYYDNMDYADFDNDDMPTPKWVDVVMAIIIWFIPVVLGILVVAFPILYVVKKIQASRNIGSSPTPKNIKRRNKKIEKAIIELKKTDANFSKTLFIDFVASIYTKYYAWQGTRKFNYLVPFFTEFDHAYTKKTASTYSEIVIGSINITEVKLNSEVETILVEIQSNYTKKTDNVKDNYIRYIVTEKWLFKRKTGIVSAEPEKMRELSCPSCGANARFTGAGKCRSCGNIITNGEMQWFVTSNTKSVKLFRTDGLAHYETEKGTFAPTISHPYLDEYKLKFAENHKLNWDKWSSKFEKEIANDYFVKSYKAWSVNKLDGVRNLLSDRLYESWLFWISNYKKEGLTNKLDDVSVQKTEFVNIEFDKFYETATVRVHASCKDYVIDKDGKVKGGSKKKLRKFSEYWTFIRRTGVEKDSYDYGTCPNCGAPADKMGQSGICGYCKSKISTGDFSWVLAGITQDEVYKG